MAEIDPTKPPRKWTIKPVRLSLSNIGPFRDADVHVVDFLGGSISEGHKEELQPLADIFMFVGDNGCGKTTVFECIAGLFELLRGDRFGYFDEHGDPQTRVVLELHATCALGRAGREMLLRLWFAEPGFDPCTLPEPCILLRDLPKGHIGFENDYPYAIASRTDSFGRLFLESIRLDTGGWSADSGRGEIGAPVVIFFHPSWSIGKIEDKGLGESRSSQYSPLQRFSASNQDGSFLHLALLKKYLANERELEDIVLYLNRKVFEQFGVRKRFYKKVDNNILDVMKTGTMLVDPNGALTDGVRKDMRARVWRRGYFHELSSLSSGELMLFQLYAWLKFHSKRSAIVLIDEIDMHLHGVRAELLLADLEEICARTPGLTVLFSTQSQSLIKTFAAGATSESRRGGRVITEYDAP